MTRRRLRNEVYVGMKLEHKYRKQGVDGFDWECTINEIDSDNNELKVSVLGQYGQAHPETWNKAHTEAGLADWEYLEIKG